ncbi:unnamed protein product, partial [marine sediment metagenome]
YCYANLKRSLDKTGKKLRVIDLIEIVYQALEASDARA